MKKYLYSGALIAAILTNCQHVLSQNLMPSSMLIMCLYVGKRPQAQGQTKP